MKTMRAVNVGEFTLYDDGLVKLVYNVSPQGDKICTQLYTGRYTKGGIQITEDGEYKKIPPSPLHLVTDIEHLNGGEHYAWRVDNREFMKL